MKNNFYIYFHINPLNNKIFYIGKGCNKRAYSIHQRNKYWNSTVKKYGFIVDIIENNLNENKAFEREYFYIKKIGLNNLCNMCEGGVGGLKKPLSDEHKRKISNTTKGVKKSQETIEKIRKANTGKKVSEETKKKLSDLNKGKKISEETRKKRIGRKLSDETKKKIGAIHKGNKNTLGRKLSEEHKRKISEYWKNRRDRKINI